VAFPPNVNSQRGKNLRIKRGMGWGKLLAVTVIFVTFAPDEDIHISFLTVRIFNVTLHSFAIQRISQEGMKVEVNNRLRENLFLAIHPKLSIIYMEMRTVGSTILRDWHGGLFDTLN
jgi:hypothetical protein